MKQFSISFLFIIIVQLTNAQIFGGGGGLIPENGVTTSFPIAISTLTAEQLNADFGLLAAAININHNHVDDLEVYLVAPDGKTIALTTFNGSNGDNYTYTKFSDYATQPITSGWAPFSGTWLPEERLGELNNGQNGNGIWTLNIRDGVANNREGTLLGWSLTFGANATTPFNFTSSNLPIVIIDTYGQEIPDDPKIMVSLKIIDNGQGIRNFLTDTPVYDGFAGFELRGSSSQQFPKKSFGFETWDANGEDIDVSLLGMPEESDWILNANYSDKTLMRNTLTYQLFQEMGHYATRYQYVEVVLNGNYHGVYIFSEKIKRDGDRVDIAKLTNTLNSGDPLTGGYIFKIDKTTGSGGDGWISDFPPPVHPINQTIFFQYEYPKSDEITPQQKEYISGYMDAFEGALAGPFFDDPENGWRKYAVENTFFDYFLVNEISKNIDGYRLSTFLHKQRESLGGKLRMGPVWDYDLAFRNADYCSGDVIIGWAYQYPCEYDFWQVPFWWERLMQDKMFTDHLKCRWESLRATKFTNQWFNNQIDSLATLLNESQQRNFIKWPILGVYVWPNPQPIPTTYAGEIQALKNFLQTRLSWLDQQMPGYCNPMSAGDMAGNNPSIKLSPNPVSEKLLIEAGSLSGEDVKFSILDLTGKVVVVFNTASLDKNMSSYTLDVQNLPAGMWILNLNHNGQSISKRFVIAR